MSDGLLRASPALRLLGLTEYEARAYQALVAHGGAEAVDVAKAAGVPRTKVYEVLNALSEKGWADAEGERPRTWYARRPRECVAREKSRLDGVVDEALPLLEEAYRERSTRFAGTLWSITGGDALTEKSFDLVARARDEVVAALPFLLPRDVPDLARALARRADDGLRVRVLAGGAAMSDVAGALRGTRVEVRASFMPFRVIVQDFKTALITFPPQPGATEQRGVWNPSPEFVGLIRPALDGVWRVGEPL